MMMTTQSDDMVLPDNLHDCQEVIKDLLAQVKRLQEDNAREVELRQSWEQIAKTGVPQLMQKWLDEKLGVR